VLLALTEYGFTKKICGEKHDAKLAAGGSQAIPKQGLNAWFYDLRRPRARLIPELGKPKLNRTQAFPELGKPECD
jgi:hypothetical protein